MKTDKFLKTSKAIEKISNLVEKDMEKIDVFLESDYFKMLFYLKREDSNLN